MKYIFISVAFLSSITIISCGQISDPMRDKINLNNEVSQVSDSIRAMMKLFEKIPKQDRVNYFIDDDGYLYVNNKKLGLLKGAANDSLIEHDYLFEKFNHKEYESFVSIIIFLIRNNIDALIKHNISGFYTFQYRRTEEDSYNDIRDIILDVDTTSVDFVKNFQILDRKEKMVLVAPIDVKIK